ncbi:DUF6907 domain-containing protein [Micromonospora sp. NPDC051300]|uniref:DUF6907 domain-containing protein n=1 Tax=Micromonospora sp. NPDC051300 TaxID=3364286 RepID=UPI00378A6229
MTAPAIGIFSMPDGNRADRGDTVQFTATSLPAARPAVADPDDCGRSWCRNGHAEVVVGPADLDCVIDAPNLDDGFMPLSHYRQNDHLSVLMRQSPHEVAPRIEVGKRIGGESNMKWLRLTPHEALTVALLLDTTATLGDKPLPIGPAPERAPFWLDGPCPGWCLGGHSARDMYDDRVHGGGLTEIPLTLVDAVDGEQSVVVVAMHRHYRSTTATVELDVTAAGVVSLSSAEARALAGHLRDLALLASARPAPATSAPAWATSTATGDPGKVFHTGHIGALAVTDSAGRTSNTVEVLVERDDHHSVTGRAFVRADEVEMTPDDARRYAGLLVKAADVADADRGVL